MPRLKQVSKKNAPDNVKKYYNLLFGDRDPVAEPGTATGTPGNWWSVFAFVTYIFDHATSNFGMFGMFKSGFLTSSIKLSKDRANWFTYAESYCGGAIGIIDRTIFLLIDDRPVLHLI